MLGYAFMGKAHSNAFRKIGYMTWPPPLRPRLVAIAGRNEDAVAEAARRYGFERSTASWEELVADPEVGLLDNLGPNDVHAAPTIAAAEAGKHVVCEKPLGRDADESYEIWRRVAAAGVKHLCGFNYRFVPAVRFARELIEAGDLGELRHFRGRYLQDWGDTTEEIWRFDREAAGSGALGDLATHVIDLARYLVGRDRDRWRLPAHVRPGPGGGRRGRGDRGVRERSRRHARGDEARARPQEFLPVGDQRDEGLPLLRHGAPERAAGLPLRRRPCAGVQDRARLGERTIRSGSTGGRPATSSAGETRSSTSSTTSSRRSRTTPT